MVGRPQDPNTGLPQPRVLTPPSGWLGFLGIKSGGKQPQSVIPDLGPVLEMTKFYQAGLRAQLISPTASVAAGLNTAVLVAQVPQGKNWYIEYITAQSQAAGAVANFYGHIVVSDQGGNNVNISRASPTVVTGEQAMTVIDTPIMLLSGYRIYVATYAPAAFTAFNWLVNAIGMEISA